MADIQLEFMPRLTGFESSDAQHGLTHHPSVDIVTPDIPADKIVPDYPSIKFLNVLLIPLAPETEELVIRQLPRFLPLHIKGKLVDIVRVES